MTNDQGNTGSGGTLTDTDTVTITVDAVNDAPVNNDPGRSDHQRRHALVFSTGNGNAISISDLDAGGSAVEVTLTATNGAITLSRHHGSLVHCRRWHARRDDDVHGHHQPTSTRP